MNKFSVNRKRFRETLLNSNNFLESADFCYTRDKDLNLCTYEKLRFYLIVHLIEIY